MGVWVCGRVGVWVRESVWGCLCAPSRLPSARLAGLRERKTERERERGREREREIVSVSLHSISGSKYNRALIFCIVFYKWDGARVQRLG